MGRRFAVILGAATALLALVAGNAWAATATTGGASLRSSTLVVVYGSADPTTADSAWFFEYGTDQQNLGHMTPPVPFTKAGPSGQLSKSLSNLTANTTYYYRLVVEQTADDPASASYGATLTFTTPMASYQPATTLGADTVTATSERLHGLVDALDSNSGWTFEYATNSSFTDKAQIAPRPGRAIGAGVAEVQALVTGLTAHTTYYYRLLVAQGSNPITLYDGATKTFTAGSSPHPPATAGTASLTSHRLKVQSAAVSIPIKCAGAATAGCAGKVSLMTARTSCAIAPFRLHGGATKTLRAMVSTACERLLRKAAHHALKATAKVTFTTRQKPFSAAVTLVGT